VSKGLHPKDAFQVELLVIDNVHSKENLHDLGIAVPRPLFLKGTIEVGREIVEITVRVQL
jgi:hypothetical protein